MLVVIDVRRHFLFWASVSLKAEADLSLADQRLKLDRFGAPMLKNRRLDVAKGETFTILAWRSDSYRVGDRVPLGRVANKLPIRLRWDTVSTL